MNTTPPILAAFTKGPWFTAKDGWGQGTVQHNLPTGHIGQICIVQSTGAKTQVEGYANACLIAAAPDLLAACEELLRMGDLNELSTVGLPEYDQARAAIAKAKGHQ